MAEMRTAPTRMALSQTKKKLQTAQRGHKLLKDKRDELMRRFLALLEDNRQRRGQLQAELEVYYRQMACARAQLGQADWETALCWPGPRLSVVVERQKNMAGSLPKLTPKAPPQPMLCLETADLVEAMQHLKAVWPELLRLAQAEEAARRMSRELERTRRRVNALEHVLIPQYQRTQRRIRMQLEENDRANNTRLLKVKDLVLEKAHIAEKKS